MYYIFLGYTILSNEVNAKIDYPRYHQKLGESHITSPFLLARPSPVLDSFSWMFLGHWLGLYTRLSSLISFVQRIQHWLCIRFNIFFIKNILAPKWRFPKNLGTPKSSILMRFSIVNHQFWGSPILGNPHFRTLSATMSRYKADVRRIYGGPTMVILITNDHYGWT